MRAVIVGGNSRSGPAVTGQTTVLSRLSRIAIQVHKSYCKPAHGGFFYVRGMCRAGGSYRPARFGLALPRRLETALLPVTVFAGLPPAPFTRPMAAVYISS